MYGMLSGQREGRSRKVYASTLVWGLLCAIINPLLFEWIYPASEVDLLLVACVVLFSIILLFFAGRKKLSDAVFFRWMQVYFYFYTFHMIVHAAMNAFHVLHFGALLLSIQLCALSFREKRDVTFYNIASVLALLVVISFFRASAEIGKNELYVLSVFAFLCANMLSMAKISIMSHMRLHRDVLQALSHKSEDALFIADMQGVIRDVNMRSIELFGYERDQLVNSDFRMLRKEDLSSEDIIQGLEIIKSNKFWIADATLVDRNGKEFIAYISICKIERGEEQLLVYRVRDRSEEIKNQNELMRARDEARAASDTKSRFVATVSHEIRTPLNGVIGMANLLSSTKLDNRQMELVETIQKSGQSLMVLINDILDFSKTESGRIELNEEEVDLREMIQDITSLLSTHASAKGIGISMNVDMQVPERILIDGARIKQVLLNLIGNAVKFTERGGVQIIVTSKRKEGKEFELTLLIEDTGIGIPEDKISGVFEAFFQVDASASRKYGGTGLGLAISRQLVELMRGQINVKSKFGQGTCFSVVLPVIALEKVAASDHLNTIPWNQGDFESYKILIAEDNMINQKVIQYMLDSIGLKWNVVQNGEEAVAFCRDHKTDIILMDVQMPVMDGLQATKLIKAHDPDVYVIALTANHSEKDRHICLEAGMNDFISKPFVVDQLKQALNRKLSGHATS